MGTPLPGSRADQTDAGIVAVMFLKITGGVSGFHGSAVSLRVFFPVNPTVEIAVQKLRLRREKAVVNISGSADGGDKIGEVFFLGKAAKLGLVFEPNIQHQIGVILKDFTEEIGRRRLVSTDFKQIADFFHLRFCT